MRSKTAYRVAFACALVASSVADGTVDRAVPSAARWVLVIGLKRCGLGRPSLIRQVMKVGYGKRTTPQNRLDLPLGEARF